MYYPYIPMCVYAVCVHIVYGIFNTIQLKQAFIIILLLKFYSLESHSIFWSLDWIMTLYELPNVILYPKNPSLRQACTTVVEFFSWLFITCILHHISMKFSLKCTPWRSRAGIILSISQEWSEAQVKGLPQNHKVLLVSESKQKQKPNAPDLFF